MKLFILALVFLAGSCSAYPGPESKEYHLYYLIGATGKNMYLIQDGERKYFYFDRKRSAPDALRAWNNLKWNVIYPNAHGKIKIYGVPTAGGEFILEKWSISRPFLVRKIKNPGYLPLHFVDTEKERLTCDEFVKCPENLNQY